MTEAPSARRATPVEIRAEFERLVVDDLYGPAGGPDEQLTDMPPSDRYLVGMLAPRRTPAAVDASRADASEPEVGGDDAPVDTPAARPALHPASKGMSFAVPSALAGLTVTCTWGRYHREEAGSVAEAPGSEPSASSALDAAQGGQPSTRDGSRQEALPGTDDTHAAAASVGPVRVWRREDVTVPVTVPLPRESGPIDPLAVPGHPGVHLSGRIVHRGASALVSLFLVNDQDPVKRSKDAAWMFQAEFAVSADGKAVFLGRDHLLEGRRLTGSQLERDELAHLAMMYRRHVEFAVGHGTAVHWETAPGDPTRAWELRTRSVPRYEVPLTEPPRPGEPGFDGLAETVLDMRELARAADATLPGMLEPLVTGYRTWLSRQARRIALEADLAPHADAAAYAISQAEQIAVRLAASLQLLRDDAAARDAFRFANHAMWQQRVRTIGAGLVRQGRFDDMDAALAEVDVPRNRSWRPFQAAFLLLNLPSLTDPRHPERSATSGLADLLFFPTGGGKTEAYLGLTAYTFAIRRLQGTRWGRDGADGVAVLMRYTLRLLTAQQFQRAAALVAACEVRRREHLADGDARWSGAPFRIGLWVGSSVTPNRAAAAAEGVARAKLAGRAGMGRSTPLQLTVCPWCGRSLSLVADVVADTDLWRTLVYCSDRFGECPFSPAGEQATMGLSSPGQREGIPVVTVDDEIYRLLPTLVISTADKFAQLPWQGPLHLLFGSVSRRCTRHGYRSPDLDTPGSGREEKDSHPARGALPRAHTADVDPLRPPDLIIQDELHLISGPLGSLTGLYETAIDSLASWRVGPGVGPGQLCRPKVIASTATVRRAGDQVHRLFARALAVFPPPVLDVEDNYFSVQRRTTPDPDDPTIPIAPGRLYLGICGFGHRLKAVQTRVFITLLAAGKRLFDRYGEDADAYLTMVGYFSALRELAGGRRLIDDDVRSRLARAQDRGLGLRRLRIIEELTSRKSSADIPATLDQLGIRFSRAGEDAYASARLPVSARSDAGLADGYRPIDVLLATNMISVGVDVPRLGLMAVIGQPKATSEYIQATSRVGRDAQGPGIVLALYNWARPRDLSHFESFEHYHATFYTHVEALSVTPFAPRAIDRGLTALLVALVRHADVIGAGAGWNPERGAQHVPATESAIEELTRRIVERAEYVQASQAEASAVEEAIAVRLTGWSTRQGLAVSQGASLSYRGRDASSTPLLHTPVPGSWDEWTAPNSLRETEANVNLLIDTYDGSIGGAPAFRLPEPGRESAGGSPPATSEELDLDASGEPADLTAQPPAGGAP